MSVMTVAEKKNVVCLLIVMNNPSDKVSLHDHS